MQFRIRTLFTLTTISALLVWVFYVLPHWLGLLVLILVYCLLPAAIVSGIVYCRGARQAFFVGVAPWIALSSSCVVGYWFAEFRYIPFLPGAWPYNVDADAVFFVKAMLVTPLIIAPMSGLVGVAIRAWAISVRRPNE